MKTRKAWLLGLVVGFFAVAGFGTPLFDIDTFDDWDDALGTTINPMPEVEWDDFMFLPPNDDPLTPYPEFFSYPEEPQFYTEPELYVIEPPYVYTPPPGGEPLDDAGLVMSWGNPGEDETYTAAWEYVFPEDPNLTGMLLNAVAMPPQFPGIGQMNSIGLGLVDGAGLLRTWTWNCGPTANPATNTLAWNQVWNMTIGPIAPMVTGPPGPSFFGPALALNAGTAVPPRIFSAGFGTPGPYFNPANVVGILALENGSVVAQLPPPPGGWPGGVSEVMWNWWQRLSVAVPEGSTLPILAVGLCLLLCRRRR
jgi:hypothetical protein